MRSIRSHIIRIYEQDKGYSLYAGHPSKLERQPLDHECDQISKSYLRAQRRLDDVLSSHGMPWSMTFRYDGEDSWPVVAYGVYMELPLHHGQSGIVFIHALELESLNDLHRCVGAILASLSTTGIRRLSETVIGTATGNASSTEQAAEIAREVDSNFSKYPACPPTFNTTRIKRIEHDCAGASSVAWRVFAIQQQSAAPPWEVFDVLGNAEAVTTVVSEPFHQSLIASDVQAQGLMRYLNVSDRPSIPGVTESAEIANQSSEIVSARVSDQSIDEISHQAAEVEHPEKQKQLSMKWASFAFVLFHIVVICLSLYIIQTQRDLKNSRSRILQLPVSSDNPKWDRKIDDSNLPIHAKGQENPSLGRNGDNAGELSQRHAIANLYDTKKEVRLSAIAALRRDGILQENLVPMSLEYAAAHIDNVDGLENTLLVLQYVNREILRRYRKEILEFLDIPELRDRRLAKAVFKLKKIIT